MRKFFLRAGVVLAAAAGQAAGQDRPVQPPAPIVPYAPPGPAPMVAQAQYTNPAPYPGPMPYGGGGFPVDGGMAGPSGPVSAPIGSATGAAPTGRGYVEASYLLMFSSNSSLQLPVATGGPSLGIIGRPGTTYQINNPNFDYGTHSGLRVAAGGWVGDTQLGFEGVGTYIGRQTDGQSINVGSTTVLSRPFFDPITQAETAKILASPGAFAGGVAVTASNMAWGFEANPFLRVASGGAFTLDLISGFRYFQHQEDLNIYDTSAILAGGASAFNGFGVAFPSTIATHDRFGVTNTFYGGQIGAKLGFGGGGLFLDLTGKIAIGGVRQFVNASGDTTVLGGGFTTPVTANGGFYTSGSQGTARSVTRFAVLPEANAQIGYQFAPWLNAFCGYSVLYLSAAARPGDQVTRTLPTNNLPTVPTFVARPLTTAPTDVINGDIFFHGFNFGVTLLY